VVVGTEEGRTDNEGETEAEGRIVGWSERLGAGEGTPAPSELQYVAKK
jgi:hypothetical protein